MFPTAPRSYFAKHFEWIKGHDIPPITSGYGLVAMTFASHAKGREFDPHYPYISSALFFVVLVSSNSLNTLGIHTNTKRALPAGKKRTSWITIFRNQRLTHTTAANIFLPLPTHLAVDSLRSWCTKIRPPGIEPGTIWFMQNLQSDALPTVI